MKTFMEEYGLIIVAILVVAALIALAVAFNSKSSQNANDAIDNFTTSSLASIDGAYGEVPTSSKGGLYDADGNLLAEITVEQVEEDYASSSLVRSLGVNQNSVSRIVIPYGVTRIGCDVFCGCFSLTSVTIPSSVKSIDHYAFGSCTSLTSLTIPNSVTRIGDYAFSTCTALTSLTIPNSVKSIAHHAFNDCTALTSLTIPDSVTSIGKDAFLNVSHITYNGSAPGSPWGATAIN